jgi:hypothetical protein
VTCESSFVGSWPKAALRETEPLRPNTRALSRNDAFGAHQALAPKVPAVNPHQPEGPTRRSLPRRALVSCLIAAMANGAGLVHHIELSCETCSVVGRS